MTPHRDSGRGSLIIDRVFRRVGRVKRASGTDNPKTFRLLNGMLDTLYAAGRLDVLVGIRDGTIGVLQVWEHFRRGELDRLPTPELMRPLADVSTWALRAPTGPDNRATRRQAAKALMALASPEATIGELPALLRQHRAALEHRHHATFNRHRAAVQAFLHDILGRAHRLYLDVGAIPTLKESPRKARPMSVTEFREVVAKLEPAHAAIAWALVTTGMGRREYWQTPWEELVDRVVIHGTKREGRERAVPRVMGVARPQREYAAFRRAWGEVSDGRTPYQLRHTYARWMQEAKIPRTRRRLYLGHGAADVTDTYEPYELTTYLREDAGRLQGLLGLRARKDRSA